MVLPDRKYVFNVLCDNSALDQFNRFGSKLDRKQVRKSNTTTKKGGAVSSRLLPPFLILHMIVHRIF